jgi:hypothetical protein
VGRRLIPASPNAVRVALERRGYERAVCDRPAGARLAEEARILAEKL